uniref:Uncharacterized protein n=1 Tax=Rhizophora mucronata TaxID=61149 RepID=A0A2P2L1V5_RHIMU
MVYLMDDDASCLISKFFFLSFFIFNNYVVFRLLFGLVAVSLHLFTGRLSISCMYGGLLRYCIKGFSMDNFRVN